MLVSIIHGLPTGDVMKGEKTFGSEILNEGNWKSMRVLTSNPRIKSNQYLVSFSKSFILYHKQKYTSVLGLPVVPPKNGNWNSWQPWIICPKEADRHIPCLEETRISGGL
jgi:hypothetical protein